MEYTEMNDSLLLTEYDNLLMRKSLIEGDLDATLNALKDSKLDYMTKYEYEKDIRDDKRELNIVENEINIIEPIMIDRNLLETDKTLVKKIN